jgi:aspartate beta-hydroxylase
MGNPHIQRLLEAAFAAQQRGDMAAAARGYQAVLQEQPENPHALNSLGMMALNGGAFPKAEALFRQAATADPAEPALWLNVANAQRQQGDDAGERASLDAALALDQRHFMALLRKAELLERLEERGGAAQAWSGIVALAAQANDLPAALTQAVRHGQAYVAAHADVLGAALNAGLSDARKGLSRQELRRFDAAVDVMLGKRRIYRNEAHGVEFPFLPADEFFDRDFFPWMPALEAQTGAIREELRALLAAGDGPLRPYVAMDAGTPANKWTPLDNSLDWGAMFLWEYGERNDALCARCPATAAALEAIPRAEMAGRAPSAFFSLLKPRTRIPPHTGVTNLRTIIHLPLIVPEGCTFRVGGEIRAWREGEAFAFDDSIEHEAINDSDDLRAVLIFDVWNPWLTEVEKRLVQTMFAVSDASGLSPQQERGAGF